MWPKSSSELFEVTRGAHITLIAQQHSKWLSHYNFFIVACSQHQSWSSWTMLTQTQEKTWEHTIPLSDSQSCLLVTRDFRPAVRDIAHHSPPFVHMQFLILHHNHCCWTTIREENRQNTAGEKKKLAQGSLYILYPRLWQTAHTGALPSLQ